MELSLHFEPFQIDQSVLLDRALDFVPHRVKNVHDDRLLQVPPDLRHLLVDVRPHVLELSPRLSPAVPRHLREFDQEIEPDLFVRLLRHVHVVFVLLLQQPFLLHRELGELSLHPLPRGHHLQLQVVPLVEHDSLFERVELPVPSEAVPVVPVTGVQFRGQRARHGRLGVVAREVQDLADPRRDRDRTDLQVPLHGHPVRHAAEQLEVALLGHSGAHLQTADHLKKGEKPVRDEAAGGLGAARLPGQDFAVTKQLAEHHLPRLAGNLHEGTHRLHHVLVGLKLPLLHALAKRSPHLLKLPPRLAAHDPFFPFQFVLTLAICSGYDYCIRRKLDSVLDFPSLRHFVVDVHSLFLLCFLHLRIVLRGPLQLIHRQQPLVCRHIHRLFVVGKSLHLLLYRFPAPRPDVSLASPHQSLFHARVRRSYFNFLFRIGVVSLVLIGWPREPCMLSTN
mmetsp:Transcript_9732/g.23995  ORF Transcript_9732/g.23995 Transcript_9732/m.23995 type:complete len:450 (+) Transcript_9732:1694-3043(+)